MTSDSVERQYCALERNGCLPQRQLVTGGQICSWQGGSLAEAAKAGATWTSAAHDAGVADPAHCTRTFKRVCGINPATLAPARRQ